MIPIAMAKPIMVFIIMGLLLCYERVLDFLNIPPSKYTYAKVVLREDRREDWGTHRPGVGMTRPLAFNYRVSFEYGNHKLIELIVPKKTYESISVGSWGVLVHTKSRFRGFHVDKKIPDIVKPKKKSATSNKRKK